MSGRHIRARADALVAGARIVGALVVGALVAGPGKRTSTWLGCVVACAAPAFGGVRSFALVANPIALVAGVMMSSVAPAGEAFTLPAASGLPMDQLGRIIVADKDPVLRPFVMGLLDGDGKEIRTNPLLSVSAHAMLLTPGTYTVVLRCGDTVSWYNLPTRVRVNAGQTYTLWCKSITGLAARVKFKEEPHADWDRAQPSAQ
jgi:hypothetical protein